MSIPAPSRVRMVAGGGVAVLVLGLGLLTAVSPAVAALCALVLAAGTLAVATRNVRVRGEGVDVPAGLAVGAVAALGAAAMSVAVWPVLALPLAVAVGFLALASRAPALALAAVVLLFGFEGSVKIVLDMGALPAGNRALGAAMLDLGLLVAVAALLFRDRLRTPRALWASASRAERVVCILLAAWLGMSVLQTAQGGDLARGLAGFRLFQAYVLVAVGAALSLARTDLGRWGPRVVLGIGFAVAFYAALRVVLGPSEAERELAISVKSVVAYGGVVRATGSFSSAVGLSSFLTPIAVFAVVVGFFLPRLRWVAWAVAGLALVGIVGSFGRAPLAAIALGLLFAVGVTAAAADFPWRRKLLAAGLVTAVLGVTYAGVWLASGGNDALRARAEGVLNPFSDASVQLRFDTWEETLADIGSDPLGHGVGSVGSASAPERGGFRTTDNSLLKVLYEQGIPAGGLFIVGVLGAVALIASRLRTAAGETRAVGMAALSGFVSFMGLAMTGEYVEQPGKVAAWGMLGVAVVAALGRSRPRAGSGPAGSDAGAGHG